MKFNSPIPRGGLPTFHESSKLRGPNDSAAPPKLWKKDKTVAGQELTNALNIERLARDVNRLRIRKNAFPGDGDKPFVIRHGPTWLDFYIGDGPIILSRYLEAVDKTGIETLQTCVAGIGRIWFYFTLTATTATVTQGAVEPTWDNNMVPIGFVDTSNTTDEISVITQFLTTEIYNPCTT